MKFLTALPLFFLFFSTIGHAQFFIPPKHLVEKAPKWAQLMYADTPNVFEVKKEFRKHYESRPIKKNIHTKNYKFWKRAIQYRIREDGTLAEQSNAAFFRRKRANSSKNSRSNATGNWSLIGPLQSFNQQAISGPDQACVYSIDQSASHSNIMFCGTEPGEIYKSTDGGDNWTNVSLDLVLPFNQNAIRSIAIHPTNANKIYFAIQNFIYQSTNGGTTWSLLHTIGEFDDPGSITEKIFIHPNHPDTMMVASSEGLIRTTDGGLNWTTIFEGTTYDIEMNTASDNIIYALRKTVDFALAQFLISTDFGATFTVQTNNGWYNPTHPDAEFDGGRIAVTKANADRVYAYLIGHSKPGDAGYIGVFRSNDGGISWTLPNGPVGGPYSESHPNLATQFGLEQDFFADNSFCEILVSDQDPDKLLIGGLNLWKSDDGGATFQGLGGYIDGLLHDFETGRDIHVDMQEFKLFGNTTWLTTDGGIYKSSDFFATINNFEKKNKGIHSTDFWGFGSGWNQDVLIGGAFHNGVLAYNENFGLGNFLIIGGGEPSSGYVNPGENTRVYSTDAGGVLLPDEIGPIENFGYDFIPNESFDPLLEGYSDIVFHPQHYAVAYTGKLNELWQTTDKGLTFNKIKTFGSTVDDFITYIHISRANPNIMYLCQRLESSDQAKLWKSTDGAATWTEIPLNIDVFKFMLLQVDPYDPSKIWIACSSADVPSLVYQSTDGGDSWTEITSPTIEGEYIKTLDLLPGTNDGIYAGTNLGMYYKNDNMTDWTDFSNGLPAVSTAQKSRPFYRDNKLRITSTKGIWESELMERPSQPFAQIMVDQLDTCQAVGTLFQFVDYSMLKHEGAQWEWTFENGTPATADTWFAAVTFDTPGLHEVILKITDDRGLMDADTMQIAIGDAFCNLNEACPIDLNLDETTSETITQRASQTITSTANILAGATVTYQAGESITLSTDFHAESGSSFLAKIEACTSSLVKTPPSSNAIPQLTAVEEVANNLDATIQPNPFIRTATIDYFLSTPDKVTIMLYTLEGKRIRTIAKNENQSAGHHTVTLDGSNLNRGMYFLQIKTSSIQKTMRVVVAD